MDFSPRSSKKERRKPGCECCAKLSVSVLLKVSANIYWGIQLGSTYTPYHGTTHRTTHLSHIILLVEVNRMKLWTERLCAK